jgi:hypothetical protein
MPPAMEGNQRTTLRFTPADVEAKSPLRPAAPI